MARDTSLAPNVVVDAAAAADEDQAAPPSEYGTPDTSRDGASEEEELKEAARRQLEAYEAETARPPIEQNPPQEPSQGKAEAVVSPKSAAAPFNETDLASQRTSPAPAELREDEAVQSQAQQQQQQSSNPTTAQSQNQKLDLNTDDKALQGEHAPQSATATATTTPPDASLSSSPSATLLRSSTSSSLRRYSVPDVPSREPAAPETDLVDAQHELSSNASQSPKVPQQIPVEDEEEVQEDLDDLTPSRSTSSHDLPVDQEDDENMPKVKCSDCGHNVSIMLLADHVCKKAASRPSSQASLSPTTSFKNLSLRPPPSDMPLDPDEKSPGLPPPTFQAQPVPQDISPKAAGAEKPSPDREPQQQEEPLITPSTAGFTSGPTSPRIDTGDFPIPPGRASSSRPSSPEDSMPRPPSATSLSSSTTSTGSKRRSLVPQPGKNLWEEDEEDVDAEGNGYVTVVRRL